MSHSYAPELTPAEQEAVVEAVLSGIPTTAHEVALMTTREELLRRARKGPMTPAEIEDFIVLHYRVSLQMQADQARPSARGTDGQRASGN